MSKERYPGATWAPLPESGTHGTYTKTQLIFHSTGTTASASANRRYFASSNVDVESTLIVDYDGGCLQIMEASEKADANTTASRRAISVEVVGTADEPYTAAQVARCKDIAKWACENHPIARRQCPAHDESGLGWHVMFGAPGPWTTVSGKECPGPKRIVQVRDVIIPSVRLSSSLTPAPTQEDTDMAFITRGSGNTQYLTDLLTTKRWIRNGTALTALKADGIRELLGAEYDSVLAGLASGPDIL